MTDTINPVPTSASDFLEVLQTFLRSEDANRASLMWTGFVVAGGLHGIVAGLVGTPSALTAFPGFYYITETGSITYADDSTTWVIAHKDTVGNVGGYTRVPGTHYLTAVVQTTLPADCVRLMKVTTAGGAITAVVDQRELSPLVNDTTNPYVRLIGAEVGASDLRIVEDAGALAIQKNTSVADEPSWAERIRFVPSNFGLALLSGVTAARQQTFPDKDGTFAMLDDITGSAFAPGTRLLFDNDTAPVGWTRDVTIDDRLPRIVSGVRDPDGGSWIISGITAGGHTHSFAHVHGLDFAFNATYAGGAELRILTSDTISQSTSVTGSATAAVSSDGTWRPAYRDCIVAQKA